jgi:hypothetical protein
MLTIAAILLVLMAVALIVSAATGNIPAIVSLNCGGFESLLRLLAEIANGLNS